MRLRIMNCTGRMAHRKWKEAKQLPGTAGPGNMLGCCLISFHFLWAIHPIHPVLCLRVYPFDPFPRLLIRIRVRFLRLLLKTQVTFTLPDQLTEERDHA